MSFKPNEDQIEASLREPQMQLDQQAGLVIIADFRGLLRARKGIRIIRSPDGWYAGDGYAQGGQYATQLVIQTVLKARAVEHAAWKAGKIGQ